MDCLFWQDDIEDSSININGICGLDGGECFECGEYEGLDIDYENEHLRSHTIRENKKINPPNRI